MTYTDVCLDDAVFIYRDIKEKAFSLGRRIIDRKYGSNRYPVKDFFHYDKDIRVVFGTEWGRSCICCEPNRVRIKIPGKLLFSTGEEILAYLDTLPTGEEEYYEDMY